MNPRAAIPLLVFAAIVLLLWSGIGKDPRVLPSVLIGRPAPQFSAPELRDPGVQHDRASLLGKPFLLNVFASWCPTCRIEHPILARYVRERGLRLVGLHWKDESEDGLAWLQQYGDPYAQILHDPSGRIGIDFGVTAAPESFVIDANGTILYKHIGALSVEDMENTVMPLLQGRKR
ncbi:MAG: DsbE family thiol:disulfide interchange protein [Xanthomonadales bacterium]|nr:Thiol:disulfide interchange protein DsbE [Xanthomonadales bacterium]MCC6593446.1 DsbE family thiol:disulfide interchange protein [Xanthomonadales bacterium]MCE7929787.1 DsbE family thiol:disulfide interchange protein [Xanthomonadales bacterium PRO6]